MRLAREGYSIVLCTFAVFAAVAVGMAFAVKYAGMPVWLFWAVAVLVAGGCYCRRRVLVVLTRSMRPIFPASR